ncbi:MAG: hypothetical protein IJ860_06145 [Eubacterium sp.]|nr:hypothetical protein [Eubacterium sp.]
MNAREMNRMMDERQLKVAMCVKTFFNLNGIMPELNDLVAWLGRDYLLDIMRFRRSGELQATACA